MLLNYKARIGLFFLEQTELYRLEGTNQLSESRIEVTINIIIA